MGLDLGLEDNMRRPLIGRSELTPRRNLTFELVTTETHQPEAFPELESTVNELVANRGNVLFKLAMLEGANNLTSDSQVIVRQEVAQRIIDPFFDPLSYDAFQLFRSSEEYRTGSMANAAARYVGGWVAYMQRHGHSELDMDQEFRKVFKPFHASVPDYLTLVKPNLDAMKSELGEDGYTTELVQDFQRLIKLVNHKLLKL